MIDDEFVKVHGCTTRANWNIELCLGCMYRIDCPRVWNPDFRAFHGLGA
ncbi:hypothetical protein M0R72_06890 [Candidatus Pacearchaeota archaeon]|nr:hypothetical protein [Candidatus Pacearchaeota archaeon]